MERGNLLSIFFSRIESSEFRQLTLGHGKFNKHCRFSLIIKIIHYFPSFSSFENSFDNSINKPEMIHDHHFTIGVVVHFALYNPPSV